MSKYQVSIPRPKAKRMLGLGELIVTLTSGWEGSHHKTYKIDKETTIFEFEVPDDYEWLHTTSISDGLSFSVKIKYANEVATRNQTIELIPLKV